VLASVVVFACLLPLGNAVAGDKNGKEKLKELQKQRLDSANKAFERLRDLFVSGSFGKENVGKLIQASELALAARLDLCESKQERVNVYYVMTTELVPVIQIVEQQTKKSKAPETEFSLSLMQAHYLGLKVALEKEKQKK
jgi:hypothetical protein